MTGEIERGFAVMAEDFYSGKKCWSFLQQKTQTESFVILSSMFSRISMSVMTHPPSEKGNPSQSQHSL